MLTQQTAEVFVSAWCQSKSVHEVATKLGQPASEVARIATFLVGIGVKLPPRPAKAPARDLSLTPDQKRLFNTHLDLVDKVVRALGKKNTFVARLGEDARQVGLMALARAAQGFKPCRGVQFQTYASVVIRHEVLHESTRVFGPGGRKVGRDEAPSSFVELREPEPAEAVVRAEERDGVRRVVGPLMLGSSPHKDKSGEVNYADLVELAGRVGVAPYGLTRDDLLATVASAIRARMLKPSIN